MGQKKNLNRNKGNNAFSLLEIMTAIVIFSVSILMIVTAFNSCWSFFTDAQNRNAALNIARAKLEYLKTVPFESLADTAAVPDPDFVGFLVTVDVHEGDDPMQVSVNVTWPSLRQNPGVTLTTLITDSW